MTPRYSDTETWVFLDELPLTGSGKVRKFVLREPWARGEFQCIDVKSTRGAGRRITASPGDVVIELRS